jgi:hypothetical protein
MSPLLKATMPRLNPKLINYMKKLVNLGDHYPPRVGLEADKEIADPSKVAPRRNPARSYAAIAVSGSVRTASRSIEFADREIALNAAKIVPSHKVSNIEVDSDGFKIVTYRKKTTTGAPAVVTVKHCR